MRNLVVVSVVGSDSVENREEHEGSGTTYSLGEK